MSDMKCPFCQRKLKTFAKYKDGTSTVYCSKCNLIGDSKLFSELIRTRKALGVAVDVLKELKPQKAKGGGYWAVKSTDAIKLINKALKQITALTKGGDNE